jgi:hypothetical protein
MGRRFKIGGDKKRSVPISGPPKEKENVLISAPVTAPVPATGPPPRNFGGFDDPDDWDFGDVEGKENDSYADIEKDEVGSWM